MLGALMGQIFVGYSLQKIVFDRTEIFDNFYVGF